MLISCYKNVLMYVGMLSLCSCVSSENYVPMTERADTFEKYNRAMFAFNQQADKYVLKPIVKGYQHITTPAMREHLALALDNIHEPLSGVSHTFQGDIKQAGTDVARFVINLTLGLGGLFDVASGWGLQKDLSGFDKTFAKWCIASGPYIILPLAGPSTARGTVAIAADAYADPVYYLTYKDANVKDKVNYGLMATNAIVRRERMMPLTEDLEKNSIDQYASMRVMYLQNYERINAMCSRIVQSQNTYDFDFDEEEYLEE